MHSTRVSEPNGARRLRVAGAELDVREIAPSRPGAPTLVFLHEGLGSADLWKEFPAALAASTGCGTVAYSRRGNGFSTALTGPRNARYMHDEALVVLPAVLESLQIAEPVLVGHSDGASIALMFAGDRPQAVRALVLEAPHVFVEELSLRGIAAIRNAYERGGLRERMRPHHADADRTFYGWNDVWLSAAFRNWNVERFAEGVRAPVLALQGLEDEYGTTAQLDAIARRAPAPVDRILLARCGHAPHRDRRVFVEAAVSAWLREKVALG